MSILTKTMIRDILAFNEKGLSIQDLVRKVKARAEHLEHNEVMELVLDLEQSGQVRYDLEVGTWKSIVRLV